jgi:hypothetical protein
MRTLSDSEDPDQAPSVEIHAETSPQSGTSTERYRQAVALMRSTTKWLLTSAAALGAVLVAGVQFSDLGRLELWTPWFNLACLGMVLALTGVAIALWRASRQLVTYIDSYRDILLQGDEAARRAGLRVEMASGLVKAIEGEADFLYRGEAENLRELFGSLRAATGNLRQARSSHQGARAEQQARAVLEELGAAANRVVDYADYWLTRAGFHELLWWLLAAGITIVAGTLLFTIAVTHVEQAAEVTRPTPVQVFLTEQGISEVERHLGCRVDTLRAQAVGGDFLEPEILVPPAGKCKAGRLNLSEDFGVAILS